MENFFFHRHLDDGEHIVFVAHKHWIEIFSASVITAVFGFILPWAIWFFLPFVFWAACLWTVAFWIWYTYQLIDWYLDAWIATNMSVIDIEWKGIFHHLSTRIPYSEVREITWEVKGVVGVFLHFGIASISMATGGQVTLKNIHSPKKVERRIIHARDTFLSHQRSTQSGALQDILSDMLAQHIEDKGISLPPL